MIKKNIIVLCIIIPIVVLTTILLLNKDKLGPSKHLVTKTFSVKGMSCAACPPKLTKSIQNTGAKEAVVNKEENNVSITYDKRNHKANNFIQSAKKAGFELTEKGKDSLKVINYQIKVN